jgi:hypothetical protein
MRSRRKYEIAGRPVPLACPLVPVAAYAVWQSVLWVVWGKPAILESAGSDLGSPVIGLIRSISGWASRLPRVRADNVLFFVAIVVLLVLALRSFRRSQALPHERVAFVLALLLVLCYQPTIWYHYANFLRAMSEAAALGLIVLLGDESRQVLPTAVAMGPVWGYLAVRARGLD